MAAITAVAALTDVGFISTDTHFQLRVQLAAVTAALAVMAEAALTANHALRVVFAKSILAGTVPIQILAMGVLASGSISTTPSVQVTPDFSISDADIQTAMTTIFNAFAGVAN